MSNQYVNPLDATKLEYPFSSLELKRLVIYRAATNDGFYNEEAPSRSAETAETAEDASWSLAAIRG